jgi:hypothetical protein
MVRQTQSKFEPMALHRLPEPTQCLIWREPERLRELRFEILAALDEDGHFRRSLVKCPECGQLYFCETLEEADGQEPAFLCYIPVPTGEHAAALALASHQSLQRVRPALHGDDRQELSWLRV